MTETNPLTDSRFGKGRADALDGLTRLMLEQIAGHSTDADAVTRAEVALGRRGVGALLTIGRRPEETEAAKHAAAAERRNG